jgi:hypothetical protein
MPVTMGQGVTLPPDAEKYLVDGDHVEQVRGVFIVLRRAGADAWLWRPGWSDDWCGPRDGTAAEAAAAAHAILFPQPAPPTIFPDDWLSRRS